jgi:hypothetical protein
MIRELIIDMAAVIFGVMAMAICWDSVDMADEL